MEFITIVATSDLVLRVNELIRFLLSIFSIGKQDGG